MNMPDALQPGTVRIGISGWTYKPWRGVFYPDDLSQKNELAYASEIFPSIEINGTFYSMQRPTSFAAWNATTPDDFVFSIKGPQFITHIKRLRDAELPLANFFATGLLSFGPKLGPILWQLPPNFKFDAEQIEGFFSMLPRTTLEASSMASMHEDRMKGRAEFAVEINAPMRHAMEIRNQSFRTPEFIALLRKYNVALCCADTVGWPRLMDVTSDFMYLRLHGEGELYVSGYDADTLDVWARRVRAWASGSEPEDAERVSPASPQSAPRDIFLYFDNDVKVRAPYDAQHLIVRLRDLLPPTRREAHPVQMASPPPDLPSELPRVQPPGRPRRPSKLAKP
jgi:uncharacterized protein YecE (DUF72 family)